MPSTTSTEYNAVEKTPLPDVPPAVLEKGTVEEQIVEMREWFKAWQTQNWTVRDYRQSVFLPCGSFAETPLKLNLFFVSEPDTDTPSLFGRTTHTFSMID